MSAVEFQIYLIQLERLAKKLDKIGYFSYMVNMPIPNFPRPKMSIKSTMTVNKLWDIIYLMKSSRYTSYMLEE